MVYRYIRKTHKIGKHTVFVQRFSISDFVAYSIGDFIGRLLGFIFLCIPVYIFMFCISAIANAFRAIINFVIWIINQFIYIVTGTKKERIKAIVCLGIIIAGIIAVCIIVKDLKKINHDNSERYTAQNAVEADTVNIATANPIEVDADNNIESEFIFADSDQRFLTDDEVKGLSSEEIRYAINEIYARRGRAYSDPELKAYFESKSWYKPLYSKSEFSDDVFNEFESANINLLVKYR
ncbi:YARHG domain-containing protein [Butyrivibrio sp. WCE2006]|uniref:YARHG domain-containing protein n=1 Tax=Butyrivibrio sp. WCE2006 TaxID=1410611 RepID=UPI000678CF99|nr:YARHG domain-containing protein [Butyrivibrio sp. WCE2006]